MVKQQIMACEMNSNKNDPRNFIVFEDSLLIALLNKIGDVTIAKPAKKSIVTQQYLKVEVITIENETINLGELVDKRCRDILEKDKVSGIKVGSAVRRFTLNKATEVHHFLLDILQLFGYSYESKMVSGKNGSMRVEVATTIFFNDEFLYGREKISELGEKINAFLCQLVQKERVVELKMDDDVFSQFFV